MLLDRTDDITDGTSHTQPALFQPVTARLGGQTEPRRASRRRDSAGWGRSAISVKRVLEWRDEEKPEATMSSVDQNAVHPVSVSPSLSLPTHGRIETLAVSLHTKTPNRFPEGCQEAFWETADEGRIAASAGRIPFPVRFARCRSKLGLLFAPRFALRDTDRRQQEAVTRSLSRQKYDRAHCAQNPDGCQTAASASDAFRGGAAPGGDITGLTEPV